MMLKKSGKKIFIKTFGCSLNKSDSITMENILKKDGYVITESPDDADVAIINSCAVKNSAEQKMFSELKILQSKVKHVILAGCVPQAEKNLDRIRENNIIGVDKISDISFAVKSVLEGNIIQSLDHEDIDTLEYPKRLNDAIEIVPISKGCLGACTYCKTKQARGNLFSFDKEKIVQSIKRALSDGAKEIWLTSQDCGAYGLDRKENLAILLRYILDNTPTGYRIRLGMSNPDHVVKIIPDLLKIFEDERMFKFLHVPVQSGSNRILKLMNRMYTREDFVKILKSFSSRYSDFTFATDIIVGFPSETEEEFLESYALIDYFKIPVVNMSRFWPRPDTPAAKLKLLPVEIVKDRTTRLKELHEITTKEILKSNKGKEFTVIIDEIEKDNLSGRTNSYKKVVFKKDSELKLSTFINVKIMKTQQWDLVAEKID